MCGNVLGIKSGSVTITVKAKENNVSSKIDIQVYTKVTDLEVNVENLVLQIGEEFILNPIIYPVDASNKNVTYKTDNGNILKVDTNGKITALEKGEAKIIITTEDSNIIKEVNVTVIEKINEDEISFDESLKIQGNKISGWNIKELTVNDIKEKINTNYTIEIYNKDDKLLTENEIVGTGSKIKILDNDVLKIKFEIVIYGDVNGDGKINSIDLLVLQRHILEIEKLNGVFLTAGNTNKDGKNPSSIDSLLIQRHILELKFIEQ